MLMKDPNNFSDKITNELWPVIIERLELVMRLLFWAQRITSAKSLRREWV